MIHRRKFCQSTVTWSDLDFKGYFDRNVSKAESVHQEHCANTHAKLLTDLRVLHCVVFLVTGL